MANEIKDLVHFKAEKSELNAEAFLLQTKLNSLKKKYDDQKIMYEKKIAEMK